MHSRSLSYLLAWTVTLVGVAGGTGCLGAVGVPASSGGADDDDGGSSTVLSTGSSSSSSATSPDPLVGSGLAAVLVLFGGYQTSAQDNLNDTWAFDGSTWTQIATAVAPSPRDSASFATYGAGIVLFGGSNNSATQNVDLNDTWRFDAAGWTQLSVPAPSSRQYAPLATFGAQATLFGGENLQGQGTSDTWLFDGSAWTRASSSGAPQARQDAAMATLGSEVIMFGGVGNEDDVDSAYLGDTWSWNGEWTQLQPSLSPSGRCNAGIATLGDKVVMFGGYADFASLDDTWVFDGSTWTQHEGPHPSARSGMAMATLGGTVVLFGGQSDDDSGDVLDDTWTFDGTSWTKLDLATKPARRASASMATLWAVDSH